MGNGLYMPQGEFTRAQFCTMMVMGMNIEQKDYTGGFSDIASGDWHAKYVQAAVEAGLFKGNTDGTFLPDKTITRQEMASVAARAAVKLDKVTEQKLGKFVMDKSAYADKADVAEWAAIAILSTSLLMGRFFCGFICPIGALQDFFKYIGKKLNIKEIHLGRSRHFNPEIIKYLILIFVLVLSILKMGIVVSFYSPWIAYLNIFMGFNFIKGTWILFIILILSLFAKRLFCRLFCPLGAVQALFYAIGPLKIVSSTGCRECKKCISDCPVDIDNTEYVERTVNTSNFKNINQIKNINKITDIEISPECINCLQCTNLKCIKGGSGYTIKFANKTIKGTKYVIISMVMFFGIYFVLPIIPLIQEGNIVGSIGTIENGTYIGESMGFGGKIIVEIYVSDNKINKIVVDKHSETSGYYEEVFKIISGEIVEEQNIDVDSVSGATVSSRGMINAVRDAVSKAIDRNK